MAVFKVKIFHKIFALTSLCMVGLVALMYVLIYAHFYNNAFRDQQASIVRQADLLAQTLQGFDELSIQQAVESFSQHNLLKRAFLVSVIGSIEVNSELEIRENSRHNYIFIEERKLVTSDRNTLILRLVANNDMVVAAQRKSFDFLPYTLTAGVGFSLLLSYGYSRLINRPIMDIIHVTKEMSELNPNARLKVRGHDEVADLKQQINSVYERLLATIANLEEHNQEMLRLEKLKVNFLRSTSHELKTPLASLKVMLENMLYQIGRYKNHDKYLALSVEKVDELSAMLQAILTVSRLVELKPLEQPLPLAQLTSQILQDYEVLCSDRALTVINSLNDETIALPTLAGQQVMRNLISNAVKYSDEHGCIHVWSDNNCLHIANTCTPLTDEEIADSFELHTNKKAQQSTGLGLFLVKNILDNYQIPFAFHRYEQGMCFTVALRPSATTIMPITQH